MRGRISRDDAGMDLFPFMAVLICTVGALIMLLVVMVQQARVKANAPDDALAARQDEMAQLEQQRQATLEQHEQRKLVAAEKQQKFDEYKWRANLLRSSYETTVGQVSEQRLALSHLESHTRELSERATAMQEEANLIAETAKQTIDQTDSKEKIEELSAAIVSAKNELTKTKEELENLDPKYVLIPYSGPNGTDRRPIYIECLPNRVILQPENVVLIGEDFLAPLTAENPLARALRAKREFFQENGLLGPDSEPYPLLVVRPGAAATYAAARSAMTSWESEFGYELVEEDMGLEYLDADPRLTQLLEDIVIETRGRRRMMRTARAMNRPKPRVRLRPSASGGFESVGGGDESFEANAPDEFGDQLPFGNAGDGYVQNGSNRGGQFGNQASGDGNGNSADFASQPSNRFDGAGLTGSGSGRPGSGSPRFGNTIAGNESGNGDSNSLQFAGANGQGTAGGQNPQTEADRQFGSGTSNEQNNRFGPGGEGEFSTNPSGSGSSSSSSSSNERFASRNSNGNPYRNAAQQGGATGTGESNGKPGLGGSSADASGSGGKGATGSGGSSTGNQQSGASSGGAPQFSSSSPSLSESRGSGWATANMQHDAVAIQRPIYVICDQETVVLMPERATTQELEIYRHRGNVDSVIDTFVESIQTRLEGWGIAGQGIYWKPVLQIKVNDGADATYQRLLHLLDDSGIEVTREP